MKRGTLQITVEKKERLLAMAAAGEKRPHGGVHPLGYVLVNYINPKRHQYDPEFTEKVRQIRPDWLKQTPTSTVAIVRPPIQQDTSFPMRKALQAEKILDDLIHLSDELCDELNDLLKNARRLLSKEIIKNK